MRADRGCLVVAVALLAGCGGSHHKPARHAAADKSAGVKLGPASVQPVDPSAATTGTRGAGRLHPVALVTAETENRLVLVDLNRGRVERRIAVPTGPQYVAPERGVSAVVSPGAGALTLLEGDPLRVAKVLRGFDAPHITAISPDGDYVYVTDDARGTVTAVRLTDERVTSTVHVGPGAHHLGFSPDGQRVWVALGESARTIVILTTCIARCDPTPLIDPGRPRVVGRFDPGFPAHDLAFTPGGGEVWISSAAGNDVGVFRAGDHRLLFRVPVGPPPQHIAFRGAYAYLTSGYGSTIEKVAISTGRVLKRAASPYGSFEADANDGFVATASLLRGTLAIYTPQLKLLHVIKLAPATRDVAITSP